MDNENSTAAESAPCAPDGAKPVSAASASGSAQADPFFIPPPVVSNVVARQRWPWNGLVDVDYEISGYTAGLKAEIVFEEQGGTNRWVATKFFADVEPTLNPGRNRATWDTNAAGVTNVVAAEVTAKVELVREAPQARYAALYIVLNEYTVSEDGTQILDLYDDPVDPADLPDKTTVEFGTGYTFGVVGAVPDPDNPGSVLYEMVEDAEPVFATDSATIVADGFTVSVARNASDGDTATIKAVCQGVESGAVTIKAVPYRAHIRVRWGLCAQRRRLQAVRPGVARRRACHVLLR